MKFNDKPSCKKDIFLLFLVVAAVISVAVLLLSVTTNVFAPRREFASLVLYEGPKPVPASETATMKVDGHELFVYDTTVNNTHTWKDSYQPSLSTAPIASFDFEGGNVTMEITIPNWDGEGGVTVRPMKKGIVPKVTGNTIRFSISEPDVYTVEWGGSAMNAGHIFANAIDHDAPTESTDTVKYIGPGAWTIDTMVLKDNMDVYISGGAVIRGIAIGTKASNVTLRGHGFFDGSDHKSWKLERNTAYVPISLTGCKDVTIQGIAMLDPNAWCLNLLECDGITVDGVKILTARPNGDGITIQSCQNVTVKNSFVRSWDDTLVVKNYSSLKGSDSAHILFENCQLWTDLAQSMEIGYETNKGGKLNPTIQDIMFRDITVLHSFHKPVMSIHNADDAAISGIRYENITVEDASMGKGDAGENAQLIDITIGQSQWSTAKKRGTIDGVVFDGITVLDGDDGIDFREGNLCPIRIEGYDAEHLCSNITVQDLVIVGQAVTDKNVLDNISTEIDRFTDNVHFTSGE